MKYIHALSFYVIFLGSDYDKRKEKAIACMFDKV